MGNEKRRGKKGNGHWSDIKGGNAFVVPVLLTRHASWRLMTPYAHKLVADLSTQYSGFNNGYLCAAWTLMKERGWRSRTTLCKAVFELEHYKIIERTRQGSINKPNLYAFTFRRINEIPDRDPLDKPPSTQSSDAWDAVIPVFNYIPKKQNASPFHGLIEPLQAQEVDRGSPSGGLRKEH